MIPLKDCREVEVKEGDFVIYVVQGNRHAGINFGYIHEIKDKRKTSTRHDGQTYTSGDIAVKIQHADADGTKKTTQVVDIEGHWREDTPQNVLDYYNAGYGRNRDTIMSWSEYWEARGEFWIADTFRDTGKPSTTNIKCSGGTEHRLLVTQPIV